MQDYQQRLILVALFITLTYAKIEINSFNEFEPDTDENHSSVYANHIKFVNLYCLITVYLYE